MAESPLPYVPVDPRITESQRFQDLMDELDISEGDTLKHITGLLLSVGRKPTLEGDLGPVTPRQLARRCYWDGDAHVLMSALQKTGWIEPHNAGWRIEGFERHGGRAVAERHKTRERVAKMRAKRAAERAAAKAEADVTRYTPVTTPVRNAAVTRTYTTEGKGEGKGKGKDHDHGDMTTTATRTRALVTPAAPVPVVVAGDHNPSQVKAFILQNHLKPLRPRSPHYAEFASLAPYTRAELDQALEETLAASGEPNGGLFAYRLIDNRKAALAVVHLPTRANGQHRHPHRVELSPSMRATERGAALLLHQLAQEGKK